VLREVRQEMAPTALTAQDRSQDSSQDSSQALPSAHSSHSSSSASSLLSHMVALRERSAAAYQTIWHSLGRAPVALSLSRQRDSSLCTPPRLRSLRAARTCRRLFGPLFATVKGQPSPLYGTITITMSFTLNKIYAGISHATSIFQCFESPFYGT
jgi:hypothetical protein